MRLSLLLPVALCATLAACNGDSVMEPKRGSLSIAIGGLPGGVQPLVTVTGPSAFSFVLGSSGTLERLVPGTYTISAQEVTAGGDRYAATPATQTASVAAGAQVERSVTYGVVSARVAVTVAGLPAGTPARVSVSGPAGFSRALDGSTTLELLEPGAYTITASDVQVADRTYRAAPGTQTITLSQSTTPTAVLVEYGAGTATLDVTILGLPSGTPAAVTVTGPGGFARAVTASSTLRLLEAGSYTVSAGVVGSNLMTHVPATAVQAIALADGGSSATTVTYGSAPLQLELRRVVGGLTGPVFLTAPAGDTRLFVVERHGVIRIIEHDALQATPFLDMRARVNFEGERGMLSMAFDPQYAANGVFYVYYVDLNGDVVVERFSSTPGSGVAGSSAGIVLTVVHRGSSHHGGLIAFGPDGMLYVAPGDGGCCGDPSNNAQNLGTLLGKMLRIDVRSVPYTIPAGNPFIGTAGARAEIWASGLRNPWRFSFDAPAGMLYVADVGQDEREEVNVVAATSSGLNYGWRQMEGRLCFNPAANCNPTGLLTLPVHDYAHSEGCSVTGGHVYRAAAIPELSGHYLYSDYCRGWLRSFRMTAGGPTEHRSWSGIAVPLAVSFGSDGAGELYMIGSHEVWRIVRK